MRRDRRHRRAGWPTGGVSAAARLSRSPGFGFGTRNRERRPPRRSIARPLSRVNDDF